MARKFVAILSEEAQKIWAERKRQMENKRNHLSNKYRPKPNQDIIKDIKVGDIYMEAANEAFENEEPLAWGVEIDEDEAAFLKCPASIAEVPKLDVERFKTDIQAMASKVRMSMRNGETQNSAQGLEDEIKATSVFENNTLNFSKKRVTDMKGCRRVYVPGPCEKESKLQCLINSLEDIVEKAAKEEKLKHQSCPPTGVSRNVLNEKQMRGKEKILKREKAGECVLCRTDKSGKLCLVSKDLYIKKMLPHIKDDEIVDRARVLEGEKKLNAASTQMSKVLRIGEDHQHQDRVKAAVNVSHSKIPTLGQLLKDHKPEVAPVAPDQ